MDMLKEELNREINRIKEQLDKAAPINEEDMKVILLSLLSEEDIHESK